MWPNNHLAVDRSNAFTVEEAYRVLWDRLER